MAAVKEENEPKQPASDGDEADKPDGAVEAADGSGAVSKASKARLTAAIKLLNESGSAASSFLLARQLAGLPWRIPGMVSGHLPIESGYEVVGEEVRKMQGRDPAAPPASAAAGGESEEDDDEDDEATGPGGCALKDLAELISFAHEVEADRMERFKASGDASDGDGTRAVDEDDAATAELGEGDTDGGDTARLSSSAVNVGGEEADEKGGATGAAVAADDNLPGSPAASPSGSPTRPLKLVTPLQPYCPPLGPSYVLFGRPLREPSIFAPPSDASPLPLRPDGSVDVRACVPGAVAVQVSAICTHVFELLMAVAESDQEIHSVLMQIFDSSSLPHSIGELSALLRATLGKIPGNAQDQNIPDPRYSAYYISPNVNGGSIVAIPVDKGAMQVVLRDIGMSEEEHIGGGVDGFADEGGAAMQVLMGKCSTVTDDDDGEFELPAGGAHDPTLRTNVGASLDGANDSAWACEWGASAASPPPPPEEDAAAFGEDGGADGGGGLGAWGGVDAVPYGSADPSARPHDPAIYGGDGDKLFDDDDDDDVEDARAAVGLGASADGIEQQPQAGGPVLGQGVAAQSSAEMLRVEEDDDA